MQTAARLDFIGLPRLRGCGGSVFLCWKERIFGGAAVVCVGEVGFGARLDCGGGSWGWGVSVDCIGEVGLGSRL